MAWIDTTYIDSFLSEELRTELFTDETGTPSVTTLIDAAQAIVEAALRHTGYPVPETANNDLKLATLGQFVAMAYGRPTKELPIPASVERFVGMAQDIREGNFQPKGLTPDQQGAHGGVKFTESNPDVEGAVTQQATRDNLSGF